jgi:D-3-phosphoglycerate dehydrogenase / 2-oxoglutarate reductase
MADNVNDLVLDLLEWLGSGPRPSVEVLDAWRTSCPRLPVWEDANDRGFVTCRHEVGHGRLVAVTDAGREYLRQRRPLSAALASAL